MENEKRSAMTTEKSLREEWESLQSEAPEDPKGVPNSEQLALLRSHKSRVKEFLSSLTKEQRDALTKPKKKKRSSSKEVGSDGKIGGCGLTKRRVLVPSSEEIAHPDASDVIAEGLASCLGAKPTYLTRDGKSWIIHCRKWMPCPDDSSFRQHWDTHPSEFHALKLFGKTYHQNRWSQSWGYDYRYSGAVSRAREIKDDDEGSKMVRVLIDKANDLVSDLIPEGSEKPYNGCLQNWYEPDHTIGLHSDDEKDLREGFPIFSLSWGGTRRFVLKTRSDSPSPGITKATEVFLESGDLLIMGGTCQRTHKHEVPKRRVTKDPPTSARINWTIRAFCSKDR